MRRGWVVAGLLLVAAWTITTVSVAARAGESRAPVPVLREMAEPAYAEHLTRGEALSVSLAQLTGASMSPLLGVGLHGAWVYWRTDSAQRDSLAWHYQPWFWGAMLAVVVCFFFKSTIGEAAPPLKKPLDVVGEVVSSGGFLVALPVIAWVFADSTARDMGAGLHALVNAAAPQALAAEGALATGADWTVTAGWIVALLVGVVLSVIIWISWHVIDVMILLCPVPLVDALLRGLRLLALLILIGVTAINPYAGLALSLLIILLSFLACRWSWRWIRMGWSFSFDLLFLLAGCPARPVLPMRAFSAKGLRASCRRRSCGVLMRDVDGALVFRWRTWLLLPHTLRLPAGCRVRAGVVGASVLREDATLLRLLPGSRGQLPEVARVLDLPLDGAVAPRPPAGLRGAVESMD